MLKRRRASLGNQTPQLAVDTSETDLPAHLRWPQRRSSAEPVATDNVYDAGGIPPSLKSLHEVIGGSGVSSAGSKPTVLPMISAGSLQTYSHGDIPGRDNSADANRLTYAHGGIWRVAPKESFAPKSAALRTCQ